MQSKTIKILKQSAFFLFFLFIFVLFIKASYPRFLDIHIMNGYVRQILDLPHGGCSSCHILHASPGAQLGMVDGNANLCMSCHNPVGLANLKPFTNADKAIPGVSGTSHAWNVNGANITYGANLPSDSEMLKRVVSDTIVCSTCHDQHSQDFPPFLRATNASDALCKDCHSVRDVGLYSDNPAINLGSHPVGVAYNGADTRFETSPTDPNILIIGSNVECSSCHKLHYANTNDGNILRAVNDDNLCQSCHTYGPHQGMGCATCHQSHNPNRANIYMIKDTIQTPNSGLWAVSFFAQTGTNSFADGDAVYDGVCEACHTTTNFHRNNSSGNHNHSAGLNCTSCHTHEDAFSVNCTSCHGYPPNGTNSPNLDGSHTTHYAPTAFGPQLNQCEDCHLFSGATHNNGVVDFADNQQFATTNVCDNCHSNGGVFDGVNDPDYGAKSNWADGVYAAGNLLPGKENWCAGCHDSAPASSNPDGSGILAPDVAGDKATYGYYYSGHGKNQVVSCTSCHDPASGHLDGEARSYAYDQTIANLDGAAYRTGYRLTQINGAEPMRIPLNDPSIAPFDSTNFRLCINCHDWESFIDSTLAFSTNFNHSGANAEYSFGYGVVTDQNNHLHNHLNFDAHGRVEPYWDSDWDFNTTAVVPGSVVPEINGYDSYITCVTCHDVHGGQAFGGNTEGNMMRDGRLQGREPGLNFTYLIEATSGFPMVTSVGANRENSVGGVIRSGVDYRAGYNGTDANTICGGCHGEVYPATDEYDATGNGGNGCTPCHPFSTSNSYFMEYYRSPSALSCTLCHGQPPDGTSSPNYIGSHETHISGANGPGITDCLVCHADPATPTHLNRYTSFASGTDANSNGNIELDETDVCDNCHSPGGTYDGVNDPVIGAKNNWQNGVYTGADLTVGKEKWCATCHDEDPANSMADGSGVFAPKVIGDESVSSRYGIGYGFYKTGHGLPTEETYPASGGVTAGAGLSCSACHDYSTSHIDHVARTFDDGDLSTTDPSVYRIAYRLKLLGGLEPMQIPLPLNTVPFNSTDQFRLCYSCHDSGPFLSSSNMNTNLVTDGVNRHEYHFRYNQLRYAADWSGANSSRMTCISCHNVHGSSYLAMARDGKLINSEPGLQIWYNNDAITEYLTYNADPPTPEDVRLVASTGTIWIGSSSGNLCSHCHGNGNTNPEYRFPFQDVNKAPWLEWVGNLDFENDGVNPDSGLANNEFLFRLNYFDINNDFPSIYQVLVDANGDGILDSIDMDVQVGDENFTDGSAYSATVNITRPNTGPGNVDYRFYYVSTDSVATGTPTTNHQFSVNNNVPTLNWSGNLFFESDGIHPNVGPAGNFNFEVVYTDIDGDFPSIMNLIIDDVLPGYAMTAGTGSIVSGRTYTASVSLSAQGSHSYRFFAVDNAIWGDTAILEPEPVANNAFTITATSNNIPTLDYVDGSCFTKSVMPARGPVDGDYDFNVVYTNLDNQPPANINVVVDGLDYPLTAISGNIITGMTYGTSIQITTVGEHYYYFTADDGTDAAIGGPTTVNGDTLNVINALKVKLNDTRPGWYSSIQAAIDANSDTIIMVYPATYNEKLGLYNAADDRLTIEAICGPENTIIDSSGYVIFIQNVPTYTKIIGFTVTGGLDGIRINNGKTEIIDCIVKNNSEHGINSTNPGNIMTILNTIIENNNVSGTSPGVYGAGIMFNGGTSQHTISACTIRNNYATGRGGGVYAQNISTGNLSIINTEISNNTADLGGGGVGVNAAHIIIDKCKIFSNNAGAAVAGGLFAQGTGYSVDITNSIFAKNIAVDGAGFWFNSNMTVTVANTVFEGNTTSDPVGGRGGAMFTYDSDPIIINCIFWNNTAGSSQQRGQDCFAHQSGSVFTFNYCDFVNNLSTMSGAGTFVVDSSNIQSDPQFTDAANYDYSLKFFSPCIDIGTSVGAPIDDINGQARGVDGRGDGNVTGDSSDYDIGAYEYVP